MAGDGRGAGNGEWGTGNGKSGIGPIPHSPFPGARSPGSLPQGPFPIPRPTLHHPRILPSLRVAALLALPLLPAAAAAQRTDTTRTDTTRAQPLPAVRVEVTGEADRLGRVPWAVGVADRREIRRGQPTVGLDEALSGIPGVLVANRYNFALDQRLVV